MNRKIGRTSAPALAFVPQTRVEVTGAIRLIGELQRERLRIQADMDEEIAKVREPHEARALERLREIERLATGVQAWCEARRAEITDGGKRKTALFASGAVTWRTTPPKCTIKGADAVLARMMEIDSGLGRFVRTKYEINREALLAEPEAAARIKGVAITQAEEFTIEPHEAKLVESA